MNYERSHRFDSSIYTANSTQNKYSSSNSKIKQINLDWSTTQSKRDWIPQELNRLIKHFKIQRNLLKQKVNNQCSNHKLKKVNQIKVSESSSNIPELHVQKIGSINDNKLQNMPNRKSEKLIIVDDSPKLK